MSDIQNLIHTLNLRWKKLDQVITETNELTRIAEVAGSVADDADEQFLSEELVQIEEMINFIKMRLNYLDQPVIENGALMVTNKGECFLGDKKLSNHQILEYFKNGQWKIAFVSQNESGATLVNREGKQLETELNRLKIRIRKEAI